VKAARWTCLGSPQIPGFGTWLETVYWGEEYGGHLGIETAVANGIDASAHYKWLEEQANKYNQDKLAELNAMLR